MNEYDILGVTEFSTKAEIKKAYKKLAQLHHPDKSNDNGEKFKEVKAAYDAIMKGLAEKPKPKPKPQPKPKAKTEGFWSSPTDHYRPPNSSFFHRVIIDFSDLFGSRVQIPGTQFYVDVPYGVKDGTKQQAFAKSFNGAHVELFNVEYHIVDPTGFFTQKMFNGINCLFCKINVTTGMVLGEYEVAIRNIHPSLPALQLKASTKSLQCVPHYGLPGNRQSRGNLYVEQSVTLKSLDEEIYPVIQQLQKKIKEVMDNKTYSQHIK